MPGKKTNASGFERGIRKQGGIRGSFRAERIPRPIKAYFINPKLPLKTGLRQRGGNAGHSDYRAISAAKLQLQWSGNLHSNRNLGEAARQCIERKNRLAQPREKGTIYKRRSGGNASVPRRHEDQSLFFLDVGIRKQAKETVPRERKPGEKKPPNLKSKNRQLNRKHQMVKSVCKTREPTSKQTQ